VTVNDGQDWFFAALATYTVNDRQPNETLTGL